MALDGQVTYLSTDFPADFPRPRTPRRSPRLRMNDEDEEQMDDERTSQNVGMRAPIIGYEVIDQRQKFTVRLCALLFGKNSCRLFRHCSLVVWRKLLKNMLVTVKLRQGKFIWAIRTILPVVCTISNYVYV